jgi:hypothetical protein
MYPLLIERTLALLGEMIIKVEIIGMGGLLDPRAQ